MFWRKKKKINKKLHAAPAIVIEERKPHWMLYFIEPQPKRSSQRISSFGIVFSAGGAGGTTAQFN